MVKFFKTTLAGGFFFLLPAVLMYLIFGQIFDLAISLGTPIADLLPENAFGGAETDRIVATLLLLVVCFLAGLVMKTQIGRRIETWLEKTILEPIPGYSVLQKFSQTIYAAKSSNTFQAAIVQVSDGLRTPALVVEEHSSGDYTVLFPIAPTPTLGTLQIVSRERVQKVATPMPGALEPFLNWGVGMEKLLDAARPPEEKG
ncbi:DUF502 domain-containing protein [bacterium]|nr:DUF502 domain-containing protein [bacterium]